MIPWTLSFSGIRDYRPEQLDLSGKDSHILITGPNGAGKSTVTYCMGAVLYSSKLDVEGLRSRNLLPEETWNAQIELVFKNDGIMKIDAAKYIQFRVKLYQEPGEPIKKEYSISTGDEMNRWETNQKYTSGDKQYNFTAYKRNLLHTYKIDPDAYYLIWYQQEVNQFATMNPEERFRIFSEMHGIDKAQREWEESIEKLKETKETLRASEFHLKNKKLELSIQRSQLQRFEENQQRLKLGAQSYIHALVQIEKTMREEHEHLHALIEDLTYQQEELYSEKIDKEEQIELIVSHLKDLATEKELIVEQQEELDKAVDNIHLELIEMKNSVNSLEGELEELTMRKNQLTRSEDEVFTQLSDIQRNLKETSEKYDQMQVNLREYKVQEEECLRKVVKLEQQIEQDRVKSEDYRVSLNQYISSHDVKQKLTLLNQELLVSKEELQNLNQNLVHYEEERTLLLNNKNFSERQKESFSYFKKENIKAYSFQQLVELDETAQLKDEQRFQTIKYTMFFEGRECSPPNDLYHVPLMKVIPHRSLDALPDLHLKIKDDVSSQAYPQAMKVLWWVQQLFKDEDVYINNGVLHDPLGLRGPQEKEKFVLSKRALELRKQFLDKEIQNISGRIATVTETKENIEKQIPDYHAIFSKIKLAEAFFAVDYQRVQREQQHVSEKDRLEGIRQRSQEENQQSNHIQLSISRLKDKEEILLEEQIFYQQLGKMKGKYEALQSLKVQLERLKNEETQALEESEKVSDQLTKIEKQIQSSKRKESSLEGELDEVKQKKTRIEKQLNNTQEDLDETGKQIVGYLKEITDMQSLVPELFREISQKEDNQKLSVPALKQQRESGKIMFDSARNEPDIDPSAPENFKTAEQEFNRLTNEFKRTSLLVEQDQERMEKLQDNLETTINMRVVEIQTKFQYYMSQFQFEGKVEWASTEKKGRTLFSLFIKVRKEGHRGTMDDVSKKARGGRVGKGVSGGEESLSSLLFALALLQNLSFKPGFIVLDEFDSALDESRKLKVFDLYVQELNRKLIILTPKSHEESYLHRFSKALVVQHDPSIPASKIVGIRRKDE
ncbi:AAA family ATPase [Chryseomicrobium palamuruense]|uniref:Nuclease SbcCD subunit C n=1 Tax=Chryseomicrobium palamuruense TaxID=682973 RepID=A0ABV8USZ0_9BACL